jgi:amino acid transporter
MQLPAKHIAYVVFFIYMISVGGFAANIEWFNQNLPQFEGQSLVNITDPNANLGHVPRSDGILPQLYGTTAAPIIAVAEAGLNVLPGVLIGFLVYSGVSCANTALYVASRTLYGLTRNLRYNSDSVFERFFANLNFVSGTTRVPSWAIGTSALVFASWLPFVTLKSSLSQQEVCNLDSGAEMRSLTIPAPRNSHRYRQCRLRACLGIPMLGIHQIRCMVNSSCRF